MLVIAKYYFSISIHYFLLVRKYEFESKYNKYVYMLQGKCDEVLYNNILYSEPQVI